MSNRVCIIDLPGLGRELLSLVPPGCALGRWLSGKRAVGLTPSFPAVTCSVQATLTTGRQPAVHGIIANGLPNFRFPQDQALVDRDSFVQFRRQISFWEQSNQLLDAPRFWQGRRKTALLFFQQSMPGFSGSPRPAADIVLTPKPDHGPDGKLTSLLWSHPSDLSAQLSAALGPFPLMNYWGPMAGIASSQWIAESAALVWREQKPDLQWVYVPHLDYDLQRFGPDSPQAATAVRDAATALDTLVSAVLDDGGKLVLLSEYAMSKVGNFAQPNRILAQTGLLQTHPTDQGSLIDYERSAAVALVDHQIAHVYARDPAAVTRARSVFAEHGLDCSPPPAELRHRRCGDLVLTAPADAWFDYRWWHEPAAAPAFAKMVDIHRKPGYDPLELFWDRSTNGVAQDPALVRGSHGRVDSSQGIWVAEPPPAFATIHATDVAAAITQMME
jgi:predicted AlkP superfamily pyrophosphatase or phosphodiesterase